MLGERRPLKCVAQEEAGSDPALLLGVGELRAS